jgi:thiamine biosynthesis protein ThiI
LNLKIMILVRYGEIGIKSKQTRKRMEAKLVENIKKAVGKSVLKEYGRIFVESDSLRDAREIAKVFGVTSTSLALKTSSDFEEIILKGKEYAKKKIKKSDRFAVRARRVGKHEYSSKEIEAELGREISASTGSKVNLTDPDKTIYLEIRSGDCYIFDEVIKGVGGLPLGTQGKAIALVSGDIGSPVAGWMMMKRGVDIVCVYFDSRQFKNSISTIKKLAEWKNGEIKTYIVPYDEIFLKTSCALCKRCMLRIGEEIAKIENAKSLITGGFDFAHASIPVFTPLLGLEEKEIVKIAKKIGTYKLSREKVCPRAKQGKISNEIPDNLMEDIKKAVENSNKIEIG